MNPPEENILVIKRQLFDELGSFEGLNFEPQKYLSALLSRGIISFSRVARPKQIPATSRSFRMS